MAKTWEASGMETLSMMAQKQRAPRSMEEFAAQMESRPGQAANLAQPPVLAARTRAFESIDDCLKIAHHLRERLGPVMAQDIVDAEVRPGCAVSGTCELRHSFDDLSMQAQTVHEVLADILRRLEV